MSTGQSNSHNTLPDGYQIEEFTVERSIGEGGFSLVYLAHDNSLDAQVAIKEYMPSSLAGRSSNRTIVIKSDKYQDTFNAGMKSFINEAKLLRQFDHPSVVKVYRFFESNGTAYMVMPFYEGRTLKQILKDMEGPPSEAWLKDLLRPVLNALELIHSRQCFHRDLAPDNIMILGDGRPVLIDFGAARRVIGDMTQALTAILKPGFAPIEQYADIPGIRQGSWTDIYALAGVIYYSLIGKPPVPSVSRIVKDSLVSLETQLAGKYSAGFLAAIDAALRVKPEDRTQTASEFGRALGISAQKPPVFDARPADSVASDETIVYTRKITPSQLIAPAPKRDELLPLSEPMVAPAPILVPTLAPTLPQASAKALSPPLLDAKTERPPEVGSAPKSAFAGRPAMLAIGAGGLALFTALVIWWSSSTGSSNKPTQAKVRDAPSVETSTPGQAAPAAVAASPIAAPPITASPAPASPASSPSPASPSAGVQASPTPQPVPVSPPNAAPLSDAEKFLAALESRAAPDPFLTVEVPKKILKIGVDQLKFSVRSTVNGYLYIFIAGTAGELTQLFPNGFDSDQLVTAQQEFLVPRPPGKKYSFTVGGPVGTDTILVVLSKSKRDFSEAGAVKSGLFQTFDFSVMSAQLAKSGAAGLIGSVNCEAAATDCSSYWIQKIQVIEEERNPSKASNASK
jgi:serine/threonine protein kinase